MAALEETSSRGGAAYDWQLEIDIGEACIRLKERGKEKERKREERKRKKVRIIIKG